MEHVQAIYCGSGSEELWSEGCGCQSVWQLKNSIVDTRGEGGCLAEEGGPLAWLVGGIIWPGGRCRGCHRSA